MYIYADPPQKLPFYDFDCVYSMYMYSIYIIINFMPLVLCFLEASFP